MASDDADVEIETGGGSGDDRIDGPSLPWFVRDIVTVVGSLLLIAGLLFATLGVWPPAMAIESGSMEPHIDTGDMVVMMDEDRFAGPGARHGVVTASAAERSGYDRFDAPGDVILFAPDGDRDRTPIIHRAMFHVERGENWYSRADPAHLGDADSCAELVDCPAPHSGFVTKGDANENYDQVYPTRSTVVRPRWVIGTAEGRIPELGWVRL